MDRELEVVVVPVPDAPDGDVRGLEEATTRCPAEDLPPRRRGVGAGGARR